MSKFILLIFFLGTICQSSFGFESPQNKKMYIKIDTTNFNCYHIRFDTISPWTRYTDSIDGFQIYDNSIYCIKVFQTNSLESTNPHFKLVKILSVQKSGNQVFKPSDPNKSLSIYNQWILESFANSELNKQIHKATYFTIQKDKSTVSGNGGCNGFGGEVSIHDAQISFKKLISTQMACDALSQEVLFFQLLEKSTRYEIKGAELMLYKDAELLMTLESFRD